MFVGGAFRAIDGDRHHRRLARVRLSDGSVVDRFAANADALVRDLVFRGSKLYAGGEFSAIGTTPRLSMAWNTWA